MKQAIKNAMLAGSSSFSFKQYKPAQYAGRKHQYFGEETRIFTEYQAKYSGDYVEALIQGLNPEQPFEYTKVHVRFSDIVRSSSAISYEFDNYKIIDIAERQYTYVRIGAKIVAMGSTWLCINPDNTSNVLGKAIIQRCDAVWHYLDFYGNVCSEPMCFDRRLAKANDSDAQRAVLVTKGYFDAKVQYNEATKQLFTNSRIILGQSAYKITGYSDFIQEFTSDIDSVNLLEFDVRYEEPNDAIDDMENRVAGGKTFAWDINIFGTPSMRVGQEEQFTATSVRTAEQRTQAVESTDEHPIFYIWTSDNEDVATVDTFGNVTALSEGEANITATLEQNKDKSISFAVTVAGSQTEPQVRFITTVADSLKIYHETIVTAGYYEDGNLDSEAVVTFTFSGADEEAYTATVNGNTATIKCWGGSVTPLIVTAEHNGYTEQATIDLIGI